MGSLPFASSSIFLVNLSHIQTTSNYNPLLTCLCFIDCVIMIVFPCRLRSTHHPCTIRIHTHTHTRCDAFFSIFISIPVWNYCWSCARMGMCTRFHMTSTTRWRQHIYGKWELSWWCWCCRLLWVPQLLPVTVSSCIERSIRDSCYILPIMFLDSASCSRTTSDDRKLRSSHFQTLY